MLDCRSELSTPPLHSRLLHFHSNVRKAEERSRLLLTLFHGVIGGQVIIVRVVFGKRMGSMLKIHALLSSLWPEPAV